MASLGKIDARLAEAIAGVTASASDPQSWEHALPAQHLAKRLPSSWLADVFDAALCPAVCANAL